MFKNVQNVQKKYKNEHKHKLWVCPSVALWALIRILIILHGPRCQCPHKSLYHLPQCSPEKSAKFMAFVLHFVIALTGAHFVILRNFLTATSSLKIFAHAAGAYPVPTSSRYF